MAGYDISVGKELLPGLLNGQDGLAKLLEAVLNQIRKAQATESIGADKHERSEERQCYRNGYRPRTLYTRVGPVTLPVSLPATWRRRCRLAVARPDLTSANPHACTCRPTCNGAT